MQNKCNKKNKIVAVVYISKYMLKKYGSAVAFQKMINRQNKKADALNNHSLP